MIDLFTILFSTSMVFFIIVRAAKLDRILPWFETKSMYDETQAKAEAAKEAASRKRGDSKLTAQRAAALRR